MEKADILLVGYEEWENLGLRSIAAFLLKNHINAKIFSCDKGSKESLLATIKQEKPLIVGFSLIFQRMLYEFAELIEYLRKKGVTTHFTMGGHFPSIEAQKTLKTIPGLNSVIRGEGEETLLELFHHIAQPKHWSKIKGLVYRINGKIKTNPPRPLIKNLDNLPYPLRDKHVITHRGLGICSILASRGCYYNCSFCSIQKFYSDSPGPKRRARSPGNVVKEMKQLFHEHNVRIFIFEDDDFAMKAPAHQKWLEEFILQLKKSRISDQIIWRVSCRADEINPEILKKMIDVGLMSVYIGIESGNNEGLKVYNKRYTIDTVYRALDILHNLNLPYEFGFMLLNPYSTFTTIKKDIEFLKKIGENGQAVCHFTKMVPYAGTPIAEKLKKERRLKGTLAFPDYTYIDSRIELLQVFLTEAFHFRNFDNNGLVEKLRYAKFDSIVLNKFFSHKYDTKAYAKAIQDLIRKSNEVCLENMSLGVIFMEQRSEKDILDNWHYVSYLIEKEKYMDFYINSNLDWLMKCFL